MKKITVWLLLVLAVATFWSCSDDSTTEPQTPPTTTGFAGDWTMTHTESSKAEAILLHIVLDGNNVSGQIGGGEFTGTVSGNTINFSLDNGDNSIIAITGTLTGNTMSGTWSQTGSYTGNGTWTANRGWTTPININGNWTMVKTNSAGTNLGNQQLSFEQDTYSTGFHGTLDGMGLEGDCTGGVVNFTVEGYGTAITIVTGTLTGSTLSGTYIDKTSPTGSETEHGTWTATRVSGIVVSTNSLSFGYIAPNATSAEQTFTVSGVNLSYAIALTAPAGFEISKTSGSGFGTSLSLALSGGNVASTTIFVRFKPTNAIAYGGNISCVSGSITQNISVSGTGVQTASGMVLVNGGTFQMGSTSGYSSEQPVHSVTLSSFQIGKYEVTQAEWIATMGSNPSYFTGDLNRPVECVSWYDIMVYCNKRSIAESLTPCYTINGSTNPTVWGAVPTNTNTTWNAAICNWSANGYRLPTEAEWEFAARGGNSSQGYTYSGSNTIGDVAWYYGNSQIGGNYKTHAVGTKAANELGIYDMSGNVWEWNWDWYGSYSSSAQTDPHGATTGSSRVIRGGSYYSDDDICRVAYRGGNYPYGWSGIMGFRLARAL